MVRQLARHRPSRRTRTGPRRRPPDTARLAAPGVYTELMSSGTETRGTVVPESSSRPTRCDRLPAEERTERENNNEKKNITYLRRKKNYFS